MKTLYLFIFLSLQFGDCLAQSSVNKLDKSLEKIYKKSDFPGFAISIIKPDTILFSASYGYADKRNKTSYKTETIQPIASVSKTFIALALMKSIELGYFTLDTNINDLLPFAVTNPHSPNSQIKVKHLVTHTSSLLDNETTYFNEAYQIGNIPTIDLGSFLKDYYTKEGKFYSEKNFDSAPIGTSYSYSNIASALMAYIIEVNSGIPFSEFTAKFIFRPLEMDDTHWFYDENLKNKYATLYQVNQPESALEETLLNTDKSYRAYSCVTYPDGSLKSSVNDLTKFLQAMMKGYFTDDTELVSKKSYKTLFDKQFTEGSMPHNMDKREPNRAVFWGYTRSGRISHTGSDLGVFSFISFNTQSRIGRVMTMNASIDGEDNILAVESLVKIIEAVESYEATLK